jgi:hypothetical protein
MSARAHRIEVETDRVLWLGRRGEEMGLEREEMCADPVRGRAVRLGVEGPVALIVNFVKRDKGSGLFARNKLK